MESFSLQSIVLTVLIVLSAFFSGTETALLAVRRVRLRYLVEQGNSKAARLRRLLDRQDKVLATILVGNNLVNIAASSLATAVAIALLGARGVGIATLAMTLLILIFGEIFPKTYASQKAESYSLKVVPVLEFLMVVLAPIVKVLTFITNILVKLLGGNVNQGPFVTEEELRTLVSVGEEEGILEEKERQMINSIFDFTDTLVREVMVPRTDMTFIKTDISYADLVSIILRTQYSRLPVIEDSIDNVIGVLYVKDLFALTEQEKNHFNVSKYMRQPYFVPDSKNVSELFTEFRHKRLHIAIVIDEYGGTAGLATLEDLIEEITGEIFDEYDVEEHPIKEIAENHYSILASLPVEDVNEMLELRLPEVEFQSLGGFVIERLGHIPKEGETLETAEVVIKVEKVANKRVRRVSIVTNARGD